MGRMVGDYYRIGKARVFVTSYEKVNDSIRSVIQQRQKGYICVSNMRTIAIANQNDGYQNIMENSLMNTPDGIPLIWCARLWGIKDAERVCGPILFDKMLREVDYTHFLLGDTDNVLEHVRDKAVMTYGTNVAGVYSPPFAPIEEYNIGSIASMINKSGATIVWTSLKAPKQDILNARLLPFLRDGIVLVGVGAAFRSFIGDIKFESGFLSKIGLGGFKMIRKDSSFLKEVIWYIRHSFLLAKYMSLIALMRIRGKKYWERTF